LGVFKCVTQLGGLHRFWSGNVDYYNGQKQQEEGLCEGGGYLLLWEYKSWRRWFHQKRGCSGVGTVVDFDIAISIAFTGLLRLKRGPEWCRSGGPFAYIITRGKHGKHIFAYGEQRKMIDRGVGLLRLSYRLNEVDG
jgi:hypothetical protein